MNVLIKRRQLILATLVLALGAAVFVNWYYTDNSALMGTEETTGSEYVQNLGEAKYVNASGETADYFTEIKMNRQKSRDSAIDKLNESLKKVKSGTEEAKEITKSIEKLSAQIKLESDLEALISAKIQSECVAVVNESSAQIVVGADALDGDSALQVMEIVTSNTGFSPSQVKITESE